MPTTFQAPDASIFSLPPQNPEERFDLPPPEGPVEEIDPLSIQQELAHRAQELAISSAPQEIVPDPSAIRVLEILTPIISMREQRFQEAKLALHDPVQLQEIAMDIVRHGFRRAILSKWRRKDSRLARDILEEEALYIGDKAFKQDPEVTRRYCFAEQGEDGRMRFFIDQVSQNPAKSYRLAYIIEPSGISKDLTYSDGIEYPHHDLTQHDIAYLTEVLPRYARHSKHFYGDLKPQLPTA